MFPLPVLLIAAPIGVAALGYFIDKTGEAVNDTSNGLVKIALAGGALFIIAKKTKVI